MSQSIDVYCRELSAALVPKILKRLNDYDMKVEVHPDFALSQENDSGFVPFKFQLETPFFDKLNNKVLKSGFEIYISDFDFQKVKADIQPKPSFFEKLIGKKPREVAFARPEFEKRLQQCKKQVSFVWHSGDLFEYRFAFMTSAALTELTDGVCNNPAEDAWYDNRYILEQAYREVSAFEKSINEEDCIYHEFDNW